MSKGWDSGMLKKLKSLVGKGLSTAEMGKKLGMSKNAVVGKLNRLGWNGNGVEEPEEKAQKTAVKKTKTKKTVAVETKKSATKKSASAKKTPEREKIKKVKSAEKKEPAGKKTPKNESVPVKTAKRGRPRKVAVVVENLGDVKKDAEKTPIKTASKKTKKDLALHELLIQHALQMANLKPNQCRWPIGDPDSDDFHFCGETVFSGKPYCYEHCLRAYQFTAPKKK